MFDILFELNISKHKNIYELTYIGDKYGGNAHEDKLNKGRILNRPSMLKYPLTTFEKRSFSLVDFYDLSNDKEINLASFGFFSMLNSSFKTAFIDINKYNILSLGKLSIIKSYFRKIKLFIYLLLTYLALKNDKVKTIFIKRSNSHILNMCFWQ